MNRPHRRVTVSREAERHLKALGHLVDEAFPDPTRLFDHGLALLIQQLGVDWAMMARLSDLGWEAFWWACSEGHPSDAKVLQPAATFCPQVLDHPHRTLVIKDAAEEPLWRDHPAHHLFGCRSFIGVPMILSTRFRGVLGVACTQPKAWTRAEVAMVKALANLFSKTLEVENLKHELRVTRDALDLTSAVVEDSALEAAASRLPNRRYLDIWLKANLYLARRRVEQMAVVMFTWEVTPDHRQSLQEVAESLRGEDLLVDLGLATFLLLLPRTPQEGAQVLLDRIRTRLGPLPMGATLWNPLHRVDRDDLTLKHAIHRASLALSLSQERSRNGASQVVWDILPLNLEDLADTTRPW